MIIINEICFVQYVSHYDQKGIFGYFVFLFSLFLLFLHRDMSSGWDSLSESISQTGKKIYDSIDNSLKKNGVGGGNSTETKSKSSSSSSSSKPKSTETKSVRR